MSEYYCQYCHADMDDECKQVVCRGLWKKYETPKMEGSYFDLSQLAYEMCIEPDIKGSQDKE